MPVESVNSSSNHAGLYALGAAAVGGGAGAGVAYLTKPFLKDDVPTDSFVKKIVEKAKATKSKKEISKEEKEMYEEFADKLKKIAQAKTIDELRESWADCLFLSVDLTKQKNVGADKIAKEIEEIGPRSARHRLFDYFDEKFDGMSLDEVKQEIDKCLRKGLIEKHWDADKKKLVNCEDGFGKTVKKAARSIQGKYAMFYGGIGAAVLGVGTYITAKMLARPEKVDTKA